MGSQADIFKLLMLILLLANCNGGCSCGDDLTGTDGCSCFGNINTCILCVLLLSVCNSCGGNNNNGLL